MQRNALCAICILALLGTWELHNPTILRLAPTTLIRLRNCNHVFHISCLLESMYMKLSRFLPITCDYCRDGSGECELFSVSEQSQNGSTRLLESTLWIGNILRDGSIYGRVWMDSTYSQAHQLNPVEEMDPVLLTLIRIIRRGLRIILIPNYEDPAEQDDIVDDSNLRRNYEGPEMMSSHSQIEMRHESTNNVDTSVHGESSEMTTTQTTSEQVNNPEFLTQTTNHSSLSHIEIITISDDEDVEEEQNALVITPGSSGDIHEALEVRTCGTWIPEALELLRIPTTALELYRIPPEVLQSLRRNSNKIYLTPTARFLLRCEKKSSEITNDHVEKSSNSNRLDRTWNPEALELLRIPLSYMSPSQRRWTPRAKLFLRLQYEKNIIIPDHILRMFDPQPIIDLSLESTPSTPESSSIVHVEPSPGPSSYTCLYKDCNLRYPTRTERDNHHTQEHSSNRSPNMAIAMHPSNDNVDRTCDSSMESINMDSTDSDSLLRVSSENNPNTLCLESEDMEDMMLDPGSINSCITSLTFSSFTASKTTTKRRCSELSDTHDTIIDNDIDLYGKKQKTETKASRQPSDGDDDEYICSICGEILYTMSGLRAHERSCHRK